MRAVNYSELRQNLKTSLDAVSNDDELLVVHRPKGKSIVMMPLDEYNSLQETYHLNRAKPTGSVLKHPLKISMRSAIY